MGTLYRFACSSCDYSAEVSGGADRGFVAQTETKVCTACRSVVDVLVGSYDSRIVPADEVNRCPECEGTDLTLWAASRPCPRCKGTMREDPPGPIVMWD